MVSSAVGLALALVVEHDPVLQDNPIGGKILFHTAGIVMLTLLINATTIKNLLGLLKLCDISPTKRMAMSQAVVRLDAESARTINIQKEDRFLSDAVWAIVKESCHIRNPYLEKKKGSAVSAIGSGEDALTNEPHQCCPKCDEEIPNMLRPDELKDLAEDARIRFIKAQQRSYWRQYEHGMLGRDAIRVLTACADETLDTKDKLMQASSLTKAFELPRHIIKFRGFVDWCMKDGEKSEKEPKGRTAKWCWILIHMKVFEVVILALIIINMAIICVELSMEDPSSSMRTTFRALNVCFFVIYTVEAAIKMHALKWSYFRSKWNTFDVVILILSAVDLIIDMSTNADNEGISPSMLRTAKVFRVLRAVRAFRLAKFGLPHVRKSVDRAINRHLWLCYDIGKGFVVAYDEANLLFPQLVEHTGIVQEVLAESETERTSMIHTLSDIQINHPKIVSSIKTRQASRSILNKARDTVRSMKEDGIMDEMDADILRRICEVKMKRLECCPPCLDPPEPQYLLRSLAWLEGMEDLDTVIDILCCNAKLEKHEPGYKIGDVGDESSGIYLVVSGMIRITFKNGEHEFSDYIGAGKVIGEMGVLTGAPRSAEMVCDSVVEVFFICKEDLFEALALKPQLQEKLWRVCGVRAAVTSLSGLPLYQSWPSQKLKHHCETGQMFTAEASSVWNLDDRVSDAVVLTGCAVCVYTNHEIVALHAVPRGVRTLMFTMPSRFLLVPANEAVDLNALLTTMDDVKQSCTGRVNSQFIKFTSRSNVSQSISNYHTSMQHSLCLPSQKRPTLPQAQDMPATPLTSADSNEQMSEGSNSRHSHTSLIRTIQQRAAASGGPNSPWNKIAAVSRASTHRPATQSVPRLRKFTPVRVKVSSASAEKLSRASSCASFEGVSGMADSTTHNYEYSDGGDAASDLEVQDVTCPSVNRGPTAL